MQKKVKDPIVEQVIKKYLERSNRGIEIYGTTLEENDLDFEQWIDHLQEELMDAVLYAQKLKSIIQKIKTEIHD